MWGHHHKLLRKVLPRLPQLSYQCTLHGLVLLRCSYLVDFEPRVEKEKSGSIDKTISLSPFPVSSGSWYFSYFEALFKEVLTFRPESLMISQSCHDRPKPRNPWSLVQKHEIAITMLRLQFVGIIPIKHQPIDSPFMRTLSALFLLLPHLQEVVKRIVERFVGSVDDRPPIWNDCESEW